MMWLWELIFWKIARGISSLQFVSIFILTCGILPYECLLKLIVRRVEPVDLRHQEEDDNWQESFLGTHCQAVVRCCCSCRVDGKRPTRNIHVNPTWHFNINQQRSSQHQKTFPGSQNLYSGWVLPELQKLPQALWIQSKWHSQGKVV